MASVEMNYQVKAENLIQEPEEAGEDAPFAPERHDITFRDVSFSYMPGEPVLKRVSFTVPDGKLTAIVGDSGSGKSTILNLIAKFYEPQSGTIAIGGRSIQHVSAERVLAQLSMVDQQVFLFDDTVRENIRHARPTVTDREVEAACRDAGCDGFVEKLEKSYDTGIGENGSLLSGGERQRLSIARAILKNSPILLLDEATASLDIENELAVKQAIANLLKEKKTVVMIAHTLSIVKNADQILVVADGTIKEFWHPTRSCWPRTENMRPCGTQNRKSLYREEVAPMKKLHASGEDYLEAVLVLQKEKGMVRSVDVAQHPGWLLHAGTDLRGCMARVSEGLRRERSQYHQSVLPEDGTGKPHPHCPLQQL